jgi:hypothetical protein
MSDKGKVGALSANNGSQMKSGPRGMQIKTGFGPDHSGMKKASGDMKTGKMGGSMDNLSHSLGGATAKMR